MKHRSHAEILRLSKSSFFISHFHRRFDDGGRSSFKKCKTLLKQNLIWCKKRHDGYYYGITATGRERLRGKSKLELEDV